MKHHFRNGFTLIEILMVVALISVLAGIVIVAINPNKQLGDTKNAQRKTDVNTILNAVYQYSIDNSGALPSSIAQGTCSTSTSFEICKTGGTCTGLVDLTVLTLNEKYLITIPQDPMSTSANGTGYRISKSVNGRITVCAPSAEQGAVIEASR